MNDFEKLALKSLSFDPLQAAENVTGKSYKDCEATSLLGWALQQRQTAIRDEMMDALNDTSFARSFDWTLQRLESDGFQVLLNDVFTVKDFEEGLQERFMILFCARRGLLVTLESYGYGSKSKPEGSVNRVNVYFNWRPKAPGADVVMCSGHYVDDPGCHFSDPADPTREGASPRPAKAFVGEFDARTGLFLTLRHMENTGEFITPWLERPLLWFVNYEESNSGRYDYKQITAAKLARLPTEVQLAIQGKPEGS
jgi:hypothetical protein